MPEEGLARLRSYRKGKSGIAVPDEAEDAADAFRTGCVGIPLIISGAVLCRTVWGGSVAASERIAWVDSVSRLKRLMHEYAHGPPVIERVAQVERLR